MAKKEEKRTDRTYNDLPRWSGGSVTGSDMLDASLDSVKYNYDSSLDPRANPSVRGAISDLSNDVDLEANRRGANGQGDYERNLQQLREQVGLADYSEIFRRLRDSGTLGLTNLNGDTLDTLGTGISGRNAAYPNGASSVMSGVPQGLSGQGGGYQNSGGAYASAMNRLLGGGSFQYDEQTDPVYQAYKKQYTRGAQRGMNDTLGAVAARTGGMASSYATQAAQQAYNEQMQSLSDKIPELYDAAYNRWLTEYNLQQQQEQQAYERQLQQEQLAYERQQDALSQQTANEKTAYSRLMDLMENYGYAPTEEELAAAGLTSAQMEAILSGVQGNTSGGGSSGRRYSSGGSGSGNETPAETAEADWSAVEDYVQKGGKAQDYLRNHAKELGYKNYSSALSAWNEYQTLANSELVDVDGYGKVTWDRAEQLEHAGAVEIIGMGEDGKPIYKVKTRTKPQRLTK